MKVSSETLERFASHLEDRYNVGVSVRDDGLFKVVHKETTHNALLSGREFVQYTSMEPYEAWMMIGIAPKIYKSVDFYIEISLYTTLIVLEGI